VFFDSATAGPAEATLGSLFPASALVEQDDAIAPGVEESRHRGRTCAAGTAVKEHHRLTRWIAIFFPIDAVRRIAIDLEPAEVQRRRLRIDPAIADLARRLQPREIHILSSQLTMPPFGPQHPQA
jgi:hypothetical protein